MPTHADPPKKLFVISPIDKEDADGVDFTRIFLDQIVKPAATAAGYSQVARGDEVNAPGSIMAKVVVGIHDADVCVADLTGRNPNVMYEVAIAHAADKQVVLLQQEDGGPPFDFADQRVIRYGIRADLANQARDTLAEHLRQASHDIEDERLATALNPVRAIFRAMKTRQDAQPAEQAILTRLDALSQEIRDIRRSPSTAPPGSPHGTGVDWVDALDALKQAVADVEHSIVDGRGDRKRLMMLGDALDRLSDMGIFNADDEMAVRRLRRAIRSYVSLRPQGGDAQVFQSEVLPALRDCVATLGLLRP